MAGLLLGPSLLGATTFVWRGSPSWLMCSAALPKGIDPSITACLFPAPAKLALSVIGQIGLVLFMFLVGLELDTRLLKGRAPAIAVVSIGAVGFPMAAGLALSPVMYNEKWVAAFGTLRQPSRMGFALFLGAMLSVTAFPVMARILQEKGLLGSRMGATGVAAAACVTVLMFLMVAVATGTASSAGQGSQWTRIGGLVVFGAVALFGVRPLLDATLGARLRAGMAPNSRLLVGVLLLAFAAALVSDRIGVNLIPGAFIAGLVLPERQLLLGFLRPRLGDITTAVLLPVFLAFSGLNTDFTQLGVGFVGGVVLFLVAGIVSKWAGVAVAARLSGLSWPEGVALGVLMNCRGLLVLVVALVGVTAGVISPQLQAAGVLMALVTTAMTGPLFDRFGGALKPGPDGSPC